MVRLFRNWRVALVLSAGEEYLLCSHQWAYKIFTSSIHGSCPFTAIPCRGVEDFYNAACTDCHLPDLAVCPQLGRSRTVISFIYMLEYAAFDEYAGMNTTFSSFFFP